jgi:peptide/nickel transport system substrate-binding protein
MKRLMVLLSAVLLALTAPAELAATENVVRWASATEPLTFDPHSANNTPTTAENQQVYEPLVDFNSSYEMEPSLALAWQLLNPTSWRFSCALQFGETSPCA